MAFGLSVVPLLLAGQVGFGTIKLTVADQTAISINKERCNTSLTGSYDVALTTAGVCSALKFWVTDASDCQDAPASGDMVFPEVSQASLQLQRTHTSTVNIPVNDLPYFQKNRGDGGTACGADGVDVTHRFCASVQMSSDLTCLAKTTLKPTTAVTIRYDTKPPDAPSLSNVEAFDGAAAVTVTFAADTSRVEIQKKASTDTAFTKAVDVTTAGSVTVDGLSNGVTYELRGIAYDAVTPNPNASAPSGVVTVTPRQSQGFWGACREAGCPAGGCSALGAGPLALCALATLLALRRSRR